MATQVQTHQLMLDEILEKANASDNPAQIIGSYMGQPYVRQYLELAVNEVFPDFDPLEVVYTQYDYHRSSAGSQLMNRHVHNVLNTIMTSKSMGAISKKKQLKALLELLYKGEAEVLVHILTKNLVGLYPKLTIEVITEALGDN